MDITINQVPEPIKPNIENALFHPIEDISTDDCLERATVSESTIEVFSIPRRNSLRHSSVSEISTLSKQVKPNRSLGQHALSNAILNPASAKQLYQRYENRRRSSTLDATSINPAEISFNVLQRVRRMTWSQNAIEPSATVIEKYNTQYKAVMASFKELIQNRKTQVMEASNTQELENQEMKDKMQLFELFETLCPSKMPSLQFLTSFYNQHPDILISDSDTDILKGCVEESKFNLTTDATKNRLLQFFQGKNYPADIKEWLNTRVNEQSAIRVCHRDQYTQSAMSLKTQTTSTPIVTDVNPEDYIYTSANNAMSFMFSTRVMGDNYMDSDKFVSEMMKTMKSELSNQTANQKLVDTVGKAARSVNAYGMTSFGGIEISKETGRLSVVSCGNIRVQILRRSPITGMYYRIIELPMPSTASGVNNVLQNWPSYQDILSNQSGYSTDVLKHALMHHVAYSGPRDASSFLIEQTVQSQEGDFFLIADQAFFEVVSGEEIRHIVSCTISPAEEKDIEGINDKHRDITSMLYSIWLHRISSIDTYVTTLQDKNKTLLQHHPKSPYAPSLYPVNLNIMSGWVTPSSE